MHLVMKYIYTFHLTETDRDRQMLWPLLLWDQAFRERTFHSIFSYLHTWPPLSTCGWLKWMAIIGRRWTHGTENSRAKRCRWEQCCRVRLGLQIRIHHTPYPVSMGFGHHAPNKSGDQIQAQASSHSQTKHSIPAKHSVICWVELQLEFFSIAV